MNAQTPESRLPASAHQFVFDPQAEPALTVDAGTVVVIETLDCFSNRLTAKSPPLRNDRDVLNHIGGRYNPVNAPIYVRGAEPGDALAVDILDIALAPRLGFAVTHVARDWAERFGGAAFADAVAPATVVAEVSQNVVKLPLAGSHVEVKAQPMIGTIGTAPGEEAAASLLYSASHGGNLDCPHVRPGATVLLPVNVPGALLSLGDVHALMGEGEVTGTALETDADVTVRIRLVKAQKLKMPRLFDGEGIGSIGCGSRTSLEDNIRAAALDLMATLQEEHGFSPGDALQAVNLFGRIIVNQAVASGANAWSSVLVRLENSDLSALPR